MLGAWGCGAFGNAPEAAAESFQKELDGPFVNSFDNIVFAITDWTDERRFLGPFAEVFSDQSRH